MSDHRHIIFPRYLTIHRQFRFRFRKGLIYQVEVYRDGTFGWS